MLNTKYYLKLKVSMSRQGKDFFEAYADIWEVMLRGRCILSRDAFIERDRFADLKMFWNEDKGNRFGISPTFRYDGHGIYVAAAMISRDYCETERELRELISAGALTELKVCLIPREVSYDPTINCHVIHKADIIEVSLITPPAKEEDSMRENEK